MPCGEVIGWVGLGCAVAIFLALTVWWVIKHFITGDVDDFEWSQLEDFISFFIVAVTVVVRRPSHTGITSFNNIV